ncbi:MAG: sigma-70 family RNA polymerase sigma factor, partial [Nitrospiraceae bacterium]|nr:sigma-70 family RNA polymerase sigma factor [Nitrospiraceae bacterium]
MNDSELVTRILAGEERRFAALVERYTGCVWAVCSSYIANRADCEDVVQDVFVRAYMRLRTLRDPVALGQWLAQIARRRSLEHLRATSRRRSAMHRYEQHAGNAPDSEDVGERTVRQDMHRAILDLMQDLPPATREALLLCYSEGYSTSQAAGILGVSPDAVAKRLRYGRRLLQNKVATEIEPALKTRKHEKSLAGTVMAAVPLGSAPWLGSAGTTATATATMVSKLGTLGGMAVMTKKIVIGVTAVLALLAMGYAIKDRPGGNEQTRVAAEAPKPPEQQAELPNSSEPHQEVAAEPSAPPVAPAKPAPQAQA